MSQDRIEQIARAVMFEGYMLYPYRPSIKNTQRWTFGAVFPRDWCAAQEGAESFCMQVECLVLAEPTATFEVAANCLQIVSRSVAELVRPAAWLPQGQEPAHMEVDVLRIGDRTLRPWQEAFERAVICGPLALREILDQPRIVSFEFPAERTTEPQRNAAGTIVGLVIRQQETIRGELEISASATETGGPVILRVVLRNLTGVESPAQTTRDAALKSAAVSTHFILRAHEGEFISAIDPPPRWIDRLKN